MATHKAIATTALGVLAEIQVTTEAPASDEVVIENYYSALIPPDTYQVDKGFFVSEYPQTLGFSTGGKIKAVGSDVTDLKPGDRVAAITFPDSKLKSLQEYSVIPRDMVTKVPDALSLAEAASIPDNLVTAFFTLFTVLGLPLPARFPAPSAPPNAGAPILVYGASSSAGQYILQVLALSGYSRVFVTASPSNHAYLRSLGAAEAFDYKSPDLVAQLLKATGGAKIGTVIDPIAARPGLEAIAKVIGEGAKFALLFPIKEGDKVTNADSEMHVSAPQWLTDLFSGVEVLPVFTFSYRQHEDLKANLMTKVVPQLLESGALKPNRIRLINHGTFKERAEEGLELIRSNKISGEKVIVEIKPE